MKVLFQDYTFNATAKEVTFNTSETIRLENILLITNVTDNIIIYNFANPAQGGTLSNNVLTLDYNTSPMSNNDSLQIFLDLYGTPATEDTLSLIKDQNILLRRITQILNPISTQDSSQRQRVAVEPGVTAITVAQGTAANLNATVTGTVTSNIGTGTLAAATTLNQFAGVDIRYQIIDWARTAYNTGIRAKLT